MKCAFLLSCVGFGLFAAPATDPTPPVTPLSTEPAKTFQPFTGKVTANKVRLRVKPDYESHIVRQLNQSDLILVVGEEGDFYAIEPPKGSKAYVFRSYVLDETVEANRVNIRLEPHADAPILGQLHMGDKVRGLISPINHKWLEISTPSSTRFYINKEYVVSAGGSDYLAVTEKRKAQADELLAVLYAKAEVECKKPYEEMAPQSAIEEFQALLQNFGDFPEIASQAKEGLALLKETYLNKKISYLESKTELSQKLKEELLSKHEEESRNLLADAAKKPIDPHLWNKRKAPKDKVEALQVWDILEEALYLSWSAFHNQKTLEDFYAEQKANASVLVGQIEPYAHEIKEKPGDYLLQGVDTPIAYLYSTHVDLAQHVGKTVTLTAAPRPNNHFAFPAYFVLSVE